MENSGNTNQQPQEPQQSQQYQQPPVAPNPAVSDKDWLTTLLLCIFLGGLGIHRFYTGNMLFGILQLITLGGCGVWTLIDLIMILTGKFTDGEGKLVVNK